MKELDLVEPVCARTDLDACFPISDFRTDEVLRAKAICASCSTKNNETCKEYAISNDERHGVWGGTTYEERQDIIRERARNEATYQNSEGD